MRPVPKLIRGGDQWYVGRLTLAAVLAFLVLPFSEEFIVFGRNHNIPQCGVPDEGPLLLDVSLYVAIALLLGVERTRLRSLSLLFASAIVTIVLDLSYNTCWHAAGGLGELAITGAFLIPQLLILYAIVLSGASPNESRAATRFGMPLIVGVSAAWVAGVWVYPWLEDDTPKPLINQEYFAQISQLIPLLAIAVLIESRVFGMADRRDVEVALRRTLLLVLFLGEAAALLALLGPETRHVTTWDRWLEYYALLITSYAVFAALASFAWAASGSSERASAADSPAQESDSVDR